MTTKFLRLLTIITSLLLAALALLAISCSKEKPEREKKAAVKSESAQPGIMEYTLTGIDGKQVSISSFKGKLLIMNFWASWKKECAQEVDVLNVLFERHKYRIAVIGISVDEDGAASVRRFMRRQPIRYPVFVNGEALAKKMNALMSLPTSIIILPNGRIYKTLRGVNTVEYYQKLIGDIVARRLLEE